MCCLKYFLPELHFKSISATPAKADFLSLYFFILRNKTGGGIFTKKVNLHSAFGILDKGGANL
ncbi:hypothetical protein EO95_02540 [Methanosarcina sp. 1.H.T.1A.1]|nr:hypothetical protein EO95_02540 [Methanosarcina sp. 1.H.T.1A.1]